MDHTRYIVAAYAITGLAVGWLAISSLLAMKRSEALAKDLSQRE